MVKKVWGSGKYNMINSDNVYYLDFKWIQSRSILRKSKPSLGCPIRFIIVNINLMKLKNSVHTTQYTPYDKQCALLGGFVVVGGG